jgi:hypothetical protein
MTIRFAVLTATLALACSMGVAAAQDAGPIVPVGPDVIKKLIPSPSIVQGPAANAAAASGAGATLNAPGNVPTGWNYFHATYCEWYYDGSNNYLFVFPSEGGYWYIVNNDYATKTFLTGCVNGYYEAVYVYNSSTGAFNYIFTYPYK